MILVSCYGLKVTEFGIFLWDSYSSTLKVLPTVSIATELKDQVIFSSVQLRGRIVPGLLISLISNHSAQLFLKSSVLLWVCCASQYFKYGFKSCDSSMNFSLAYLKNLLFFLLFLPPHLPSSAQPQPTKLCVSMTYAPVRMLNKTQFMLCYGFETDGACQQKSLVGKDEKPP